MLRNIADAQHNKESQPKPTLITLNIDRDACSAEVENTNETELRSKRA